MNVQTIFQAGNSRVVSIPAGFDYPIGQKVTVSEVGDKLVIEKFKIQKKAKRTSSFDEWWSEFIKENAEVLDDLAVR